MYNPFEWSYHSTKIHFLPQKLMLLPEHKTLVIADWHLGKIEHFRKNGAFLPQVTSQKEYRLIQEFINQFNLKRIILLGDLFHSELNTDWFDFVEFLILVSKSAIGSVIVIFNFLLSLIIIVSLI